MNDLFQNSKTFLGGATYDVGVHNEGFQKLHRYGYLGDI